MSFVNKISDRLTTKILFDIIFSDKYFNCEKTDFTVVKNYTFKQRRKTVVNYNGKRSIKEKIAEFMYGRNGIDSLYHFLFWVIIAVSVINLFAKWWVLTAIELVLLICAVYRVLSKNVYRRQKENQIYLECTTKVRRFLGKAKHRITVEITLLKNKWRDRKTHVYKKCPRCKNTLRLPKVKGKHRAACPCCDNRFDVKI